ncbi:MAG: DNA translocase FtsK [Eubacteriales bacterium]|nr:DNA translocase FtsK [Eubacteriales bacterium]
MRDDELRLPSRERQTAREISAFIFALLACLTAFALYLPTDRSGVVGAFFKRIFCGCLGGFAYVLPLFFVLAAVEAFMMRGGRLKSFHVLHALLTLVLLAAFWQLAHIGPEAFNQQFSAAFRQELIGQGKAQSEGQTSAFLLKYLWTSSNREIGQVWFSDFRYTGLPAGLIAYGLADLLGRFGALTVLLVALCIEGILLFNFSFIEAAIHIRAGFQRLRQRFKDRDEVSTSTIDYDAEPHPFSDGSMDEAEETAETRGSLEEAKRPAALPNLYEDDVEILLDSMERVSLISRFHSWISKLFKRKKGAMSFDRDNEPFDLLKMREESLRRQSLRDAGYDDAYIDELEARAREQVERKRHIPEFLRRHGADPALDVRSKPDVPPFLRSQEGEMDAPVKRSHPVNETSFFEQLINREVPATPPQAYADERIQTTQARRRTELGEVWGENQGSQLERLDSERRDYAESDVARRGPLPCEQANHADDSMLSDLDESSEFIRGDGVLNPDERERISAFHPASGPSQDSPAEDSGPGFEIRYDSEADDDQEPMANELETMNGEEETLVSTKLSSQTNEPASKPSQPSWLGLKSEAKSKSKSASTLATPSIDSDLEGSENVEKRDYVFPPLDLLNVGPVRSAASRIEVEEMGKKLIELLASFGVEARLSNITSGPTITRFELSPGPGVRVNKIVNLSEDIALGLACTGLRIEAPIPGRSAVGIEVPNRHKETVYLRPLLESEPFQKNPSKLLAPIGRDIPGQAILCDISKMPHLLIAGATGSGKSICINSILTSLLYRSSPDDLRMILIDPKVVELSIYNGIPHLLTPVVTDPQKAANSLNWAVNEMNRRYNLFSKKKVRDMKRYNQLLDEERARIEEEREAMRVRARLNDPAMGHEERERLIQTAIPMPAESKMPLILIVIDELADLMAASHQSVETSIARLTAKARAAGMHLVIATQRPSVDVITGVIKANTPSRLAFAVSSQVDSRTILDRSGAENLLGQGDMLYHPQSESRMKRGQGAFVSDQEVEAVVAFVREANPSTNEDELSETITNTGTEESSVASEDRDELYNEAIETIFEAGSASASVLQRRLMVGYPRASRLIDQLEKDGIVGPFEGSKPRKLMISLEEWTQMREKGEES